MSAEDIQALCDTETVEISKEELFARIEFAGMDSDQQWSYA